MEERLRSIGLAVVSGVYMYLGIIIFSLAKHEHSTASSVFASILCVVICINAHFFISSLNRTIQKMKDRHGGRRV